MTKEQMVKKTKFVQPVRVRPSDIKDNIFIPNQSKKSNLNGSNINGIDSNNISSLSNYTLGFTIRGQEEFLVHEVSGQIIPDGYPAIPYDNQTDMSKIYAKVICTSKKPSYSILQNKYGKFINPIGGLADEVTERKRAANKVERSSFKFRQVNYAVFLLYLKFLKTGNSAWLSRAERESM